MDNRELCKDINNTLTHMKHTTYTIWELLRQAVIDLESVKNCKTCAYKNADCQGCNYKWRGWSDVERTDNSN